MNNLTRNQINYCINEINNIVRELRAISSEVPLCAKGIDCEKFKSDLNSTARRYERAAGQLRRLK